MRDSGLPSASRLARWVFARRSARHARWVASKESSVVQSDEVAVEGWRLKPIPRPRLRCPGAGRPRRRFAQSRRSSGPLRRICVDRSAAGPDGFSQYRFENAAALFPVAAAAVIPALPPGGTSSCRRPVPGPEAFHRPRPGARHSYLSASCPVPKGFTAGFLSFARATYTFEGDQLRIESIRSCRGRGAPAPEPGGQRSSSHLHAPNPECGHANGPAGGKPPEPFALLVGSSRTGMDGSTPGWHARCRVGVGRLSRNPLNQNFYIP